ncbi:MAG: presenilin family intramembrane aspartyl protease [Candidatus Norongarragalinales archaeon]
MFAGKKRQLEKKKPGKQKQPLIPKLRSVSLRLIAIFAIAQAIALFAGAQFIAQRVSVVQDSASVANSAFLFAYVIGATLLMLVLIKYYKGSKLFLLFEYLLIFSTVELFAAMFVGELLALTAAALVVSVRFALPRARNASLVLAIAVVGGLLGASLDLLPAAVFAGALACYDVIAVFYSGHMVTLAKALSKRGAAFAVHLRDGKESIQLGTGDVVIPGMLSVSAAKIAPAAGAFGLLGSLLGLIAIIVVLEKFKGYWPALPPIVFGTLGAIGLFIAM